MKVSTLQEGFLKEFGLTLRVYDGREFADPSQTLAQVRKKKGSEKALSVAKNMKVGNLEDKFEEEFGLKVQVAGSDDSYLCDNNLKLNAAQQEDEKKLARKERKAARQDEAGDDGDENENYTSTGGDGDSKNREGEKTKSTEEQYFSYHLSSTKDAFQQSVRTVQVSCNFWWSSEDPNVVYGRYVGYGGGGGQEEGCFKLLKNENAFFLSYSGEIDGGWNWLSENAEKYGSKMTEMDEENVSDDIISVLDGPHSEDVWEYDEDAFEEYVDALDPSCCVFQPEALHGMKAGHGGFYQWEDRQDEECLMQISEHWALKAGYSR